MRQPLLNDFRLTDYFLVSDVSLSFLQDLLQDCLVPVFLLHLSQELQSCVQAHTLHGHGSQGHSAAIPLKAKAKAKAGIANNFFIFLLFGVLV